MVKNCTLFFLTNNTTSPNLHRANEVYTHVSSSEYGM